MSDNIRNIGIPMVVPMQKGRLGRGLASLIGEAPSAVPRAGRGRAAPAQYRPAACGSLQPAQGLPGRRVGRTRRLDPPEGPRAADRRPSGCARRLRDRSRRAALARGAAGRCAPGAGDRPRAVRPGGARVAIIENVQRTDLNAIEEATGYTDLMERFGYTQEQLSDVARAAAPPYAAPSEAAAPSARHGAGWQALRRTRARPGRSRRRRAAGRQIVERQLNVRAAEAMVQNIRADQDGGPAPSSSRKEKTPTRARWRRIADGLGLKVEISWFRRAAFSPSNTATMTSSTTCVPACSAFRAEPLSSEAF